MADWVNVCSVDDVEVEGIKRHEFKNKIYIICRSPENEFFCLDGLCTHEKVDLSDGMIFDGELECPKHFGTFNYKTGEATGSPAYCDLKTYKVKVEEQRIYVLFE